MKNKFALLLILAAIFCRAQENDLPLDPLLNTSSLNEEVNILLYEIQLENIKIPISLAYNNTGIKANAVPSPVGINWEVNNIGKIERKVNHLPDESIAQLSPPIPVDPSETGNVNGWFFSNDSSPSSHTNEPDFGKRKFQIAYVDSAPDYFTFRSATGLQSTFFYKKNFQGTTRLLPTPLFLEKNHQLLLETDFTKFNFGVSNYTDIVFKISDENGNKFNFIGGPVKQSIFRDGEDNVNQYKDYYVNKIESSRNIDVVTLSYIENINFVYTLLKNCVTTTTMEYAVPMDHIDSYTPTSTLEVELITTPREIIKFNYINKAIGDNTNPHTYQTVKQLVSIEIRNKQNEYVSGYEFGYHYFNDGRFTLSDIFQIDNTGLEKIRIRKFNYHAQSPVTSISYDQDMFGYSNGANNQNHSVPFPVRYCGTYNGAPLSQIYPAANRLPDLNTIVNAGMLKSVENNLGGKTEYFYQLKSDANYYGGGLVVSKIIETFSPGKTRTTDFKYENLRGFLLPLTNYQLYFRNNFSNLFTTQSVSNQPTRFIETDGLDTYYFEYYDVQKSGNYFQKITSTTVLENYDYYPDGLGDVAIITNYEYLPSYEGMIRRPLLGKKTTSKEYRYNGIGEGGTRLHETTYIYDLINTGSLSIRETSARVMYTVCFAGESNDPAFTYSIDPARIYTIAQPLRTSTLKEYEYTENSTLNTQETKQVYTYMGEGNSIHAFDKTLVKEIATFRNTLPIAKKKFSYIFEMLSSVAGLANLSQFSTQYYTLPSEDSQWMYNDKQNKWILREAEFYEYNTDGKARGTFKVHKNHLTNTFYEESNYNPYYLSGSVTGVSRENEIKFTYDNNGKPLSITDIENGTVKVLSRQNDRDTYNVITELVGNRYLLTDNNFYRNSFESTGSGALTTPLAYTGKKVYQGSTFKVGTFPAGYIVSFWYYDIKWNYYSRIHTGGTVSIAKPSLALFIDEVWVRPPHTSLTGYTFEPVIGKTSIIDDSGLVLKTIYDPFGRAIKQADQDNNLLHKKEFNLTND